MMTRLGQKNKVDRNGTDDKIHKRMATEFTSSLTLPSAEGHQITNFRVFHHSVVARYCDRFDSRG